MSDPVMCIHCKRRPPAEGRTRCAVCLELARKSMAAANAAKRAARSPGMCVLCGQPSGELLKCESCRATDRQKKADRERRAVDGRTADQDAIDTRRSPDLTRYRLNDALHELASEVARLGYELRRSNEMWAMSPGGRGRATLRMRIHIKNLSSVLGDAKEIYRAMHMASPEGYRDGRDPYKRACDSNDGGDDERPE